MIYIAFILKDTILFYTEYRHHITKCMQTITRRKKVNTTKEYEQVIKREREREEEENGQYVNFNTFPVVVAILGDGNTGTYNENENQTSFLRCRTKRKS